MADLTLEGLLKTPEDIRREQIEQLQKLGQTQAAAGKKAPTGSAIADIIVGMGNMAAQYAPIDADIMKRGITSALGMPELGRSPEERRAGRITELTSKYGTDRKGLEKVSEELMKMKEPGLAMQFKKAADEKALKEDELAIKRQELELKMKEYSSPFGKNATARMKDIAAIGRDKYNCDVTGGTAASVECYQKAEADWSKGKRESASAFGQKEDIKQLTDYVKTEITPALRKGRVALQEIQTMKKLLPNIYTGTFGDEALVAKRFLTSIGFSDEDAKATVAQTELFQQFAFKRVMSYVQQTKGAVSNREMDLFARAEAGLSKSREGNMLILTVAERAQKHEAALNKHYGEWRKANPGEGLSSWLVEESKWLDENPFEFTKEEIDLMSKLGGGEETSKQVDAEILKDSTTKMQEYLKKDLTEEELQAAKDRWKSNFGNIPFPSN